MATAWAQPDPPTEREPVYQFYSTVFGTSVKKSGGLTGQVFELKPGTRRLPKFQKKTPVATVYTSSLNVPLQEFTTGFPGVPNRFEWFAINYTGSIWISKPGQYRFELQSDDGSMLYLDDHLIVDNDGVHPVLTRGGMVNLKEGAHRIRIAYFQGPRFHLALRLQVAGPGEDLHVFNMDHFPPQRQ